LKEERERRSKQGGLLAPYLYRALVCYPERKSGSETGTTWGRHIYFLADKEGKKSSKKTKKRRNPGKRQVERTSSILTRKNLEAQRKKEFKQIERKLANPKVDLTQISYKNHYWEYRDPGGRKEVGSPQCREKKKLQLK